MSVVDFGHVVTAIVTPFDNLGNVDLAKMTKLIEYLLANGSDALVVCGTTGESPTLSEAEIVALFKHVTTVVNKRVPVIAGTGSNNTRTSVELTKKATEIGVDAIMAVTPYYNKPSQKGMIEHFTAIAKATHLPIMLYNIPGRSVVNLLPESVVELSKVKNIVAIKEASGQLEQMAEMIANTGDDFSLYSGDDSMTLPALAIGAKGVVSVVSHIAGNEMKRLITSFFAHRTEQAAKLHRDLLPLMKAMFIAPNPTCVKTALQLRGLDVGGVRLPLVPLSEAERKTVARQLKLLDKLSY